MARLGFLVFLALIVAAPLPLGSKHLWSLSLLESLCALSFALAIIQPHAMDRLRRNRLIVSCFALLPLVAGLQLVPLPQGVLDLLGKASGTMADVPVSGLTRDILSRDASSTMTQLLKSFAFFLFFCSALIHLHTPQRLKLAMETVVISGVLQASYGVMVTLGGRKLDILGTFYYSPFKGSAIGTFTNRDHLAGYLEMAIATGVGLLVAQILQDKDPWLGMKAVLRRILASIMEGKARIRIFLALMVVALVLTHSRMGNAAFYGSLGVSALLGLVIFRKSRNRTSLMILFSSLILIDVLILGAWFGLDTLAERIQTTDTRSDLRFVIYPMLVEVLKQTPLLGFGGGSFPSLSYMYQDERLYYWFEHAHNDYLETLTDYGIIGAIPFGLVAALALGAALRSQTLRHNATLKGAGFAATMGMISLLAHGALDFNLQIPANALTFTLLCAFACSALTQEHVRRSEPSRKRRDREKESRHERALAP